MTLAHGHTQVLDECRNGSLRATEIVTVLFNEEQKRKITTPSYSAERIIILVFSYSIHLGVKERKISKWNPAFW